MRNNPERLAWSVTLAAFAVFGILAVSIPLGVRYYLHSATRAYEAKVQCLEGTAVVEDPNYGSAIPVRKGETVSVPEGTIVSVDSTAEAAITLFDQSLIRLFPNTSVILQRMRTPRFQQSPRAAQIQVLARGGSLWVNTVLLGSSSVDFRVETLQALSWLAEDGSYTVEANNEKTEVIVQRGTARVASATSAVPTEEELVTLTSRQRTIVEIGQPPLAALKAERDLIINGDFRAPLSTGWITFNDQGGDGGEVDGTSTLVVEEGRRAVRLFRTGGEFDHCETIIEQEVNRDLSDTLTTLKVRATVKLANQTLSGGGSLSSEYPLMIRIWYRDAFDSETDWIHGFYYQNDAGNPTMFGQQIAKDRWYFFESENLLDILPISPRRIVRLRVYASGWSYESFLSDVSLIVE